MSTQNVVEGIVSQKVVQNGSGYAVKTDIVNVDTVNVDTINANTVNSNIYNVNTNQNTVNATTVNATTVNATTVNATTVDVATVDTTTVNATTVNADYVKLSSTSPQAGIITLNTEPISSTFTLPLNGITPNSIVFLVFKKSQSDSYITRYTCGTNIINVQTYILPVLNDEFYYFIAKY